MGGVDVFHGDWSKRLSGAKLEREKTAWGAVLAEILSVASPDNPMRDDEREIVVVDSMASIG